MKLPENIVIKFTEVEENWPDEELLIARRSNLNISFDVYLEYVDDKLLDYIFGDTLAVLWYQFGSLFNPYWYLEGNDD